MARAFLAEARCAAAPSCLAAVTMLALAWPAGAHAAARAVPPPFQGRWSLEPEDCRGRSGRDVLVTATRFRDARVRRVRPLAPDAVAVELRLPDGGDVRRQLVLAARGSQLRVVEELGILTYGRCAAPGARPQPHGRRGDPPRR